ncbi:uncharacterized protein KRP23_5348 [Phytophthora ramorum]|uniref:uncharacterized protein n=1 Tax=Phytophthora ramorum TaxID=164328 RepID=UPI00309632B4|nr:hypothetical protein KRP23_5348 [Phytophthora ramorum]
MGIHAQYQQQQHHHQLHSLKLTATILTHLATHVPTIPGRHNTNLTRLPGIRSLLTANVPHSIATTLPPLQCAMGLVDLGTPLTGQSSVGSPTKAAIGSPTSPGMTPASPTCQAVVTPSQFSISPKTRRPLSLHDLLSTETSSSPSTQRSNNTHYRRQCGITDCHKYALTGGFCIRHGGERELGAAAACRDTVLDKIRERRGHVEEKEREKEDVEDVEDSLNVDEMSELFSCVEQEETSGVDFSVFIQDEDAINVEEISQLFSCQESSKEITVASPVDVVDTKELETQHKSLDLFDSFDGVAVSHEEDEVSALSDVENVDILSEIFSATLEDKNAVEPAPAASTPTFSRADREDATNVDLVADLFASLEASSGASQDEVADRLTTRDWIDALEVDNVASLFADLEQTEMMQMKTVVPAAPVKVDSRIFVPTFSVRIDGLRSERPAVGPNSNLLVGPPGVLLAGPPPPTRNDGVDHRKPKRTRPSAAKPPPQDMSISDTRRASAAKRQRVKGRFVSDTHTFVSITALQK